VNTPMHCQPESQNSHSHFTSAICHSRSRAPFFPHPCGPRRSPSTLTRVTHIFTSGGQNHTALAFLTPSPLTMALNSPLPSGLSFPHFCTFLTSPPQHSIHNPMAWWNISIADSRTPCGHVALHPIGLLTFLGVSWLSAPLLMSCLIPHLGRLFLAPHWYCLESFKPLLRVILLIFSPTWAQLFLSLKLLHLLHHLLRTFLFPS